MSRVALVVAVLGLTAGCAAWPAGWPFGREAPPLLAEADRLAGAGEYARAVAVYDDFLRRHPHDGEAPLAQARRDAAASILATREELARLRRELARLGEDLFQREAELARLRQELARRQADLERLKQIDLQQLQKRKP